MNDVFPIVTLFLCGLFFLSSVMYYILKKINFPYTIGLVLVGLPLGHFIKDWWLVHEYTKYELSPPIIMNIFLPALIFSAAVHIDAKSLKRYIVPILTLAVPGVIIATFITGGLTALLTPLNLGAALLFGALISATDPVAVVAIFEELNVSKRLSVIIDGESIFNDATAIVVFHTVLFAVLHTGEGSLGLGPIILKFFTVCVGGCVIGWAIAFILRFFILKAKAIPLMEISFSLVAAYSSFVIAEHFCEVSGVMATMVCGLYLHNNVAKSLEAHTTVHLHNFWDYLTFIANSLIFLLIGMGQSRLLTDFPEYAGSLHYILIIIIVVLLARAVIIYGLVPLSNATCRDGKISVHYRNIMFWGGLRGAIPIALVLSLPHSYEYRHQIIDITLTVVLFTIVVQGISIKYLIRKGD